MSIDDWLAAADRLSDVDDREFSATTATLHQILPGLWIDGDNYIYISTPDHNYIYHFDVDRVDATVGRMRWLQSHTPLSTCAILLYAKHNELQSVVVGDETRFITKGMIGTSLFVYVHGALHSSLEPTLHGFEPCSQGIINNISDILAHERPLAYVRMDDDTYAYNIRGDQLLYMHDRWFMRSQPVGYQRCAYPQTMDGRYGPSPSRRFISYYSNGRYVFVDQADTSAMLLPCPDLSDFLIHGSSYVISDIWSDLWRGILDPAHSVYTITHSNIPIHINMEERVIYIDEHIHTDDHSPPLCSFVDGETVMQDDIPEPSRDEAFTSGSLPVEECREERDNTPEPLRNNTVTYSMPPPQRAN